MTVRRTFTFGLSSAAKHWPPGTLPVASRSNLCVTVEGETANHCRVEMLNRFGREWAFEYDPTDALERMPNLVEVGERHWPATDSYPDGRFEVRTIIAEVDAP